ncbi:S8 family serine peptidase, partial [Romboutsia sp.]|uniref:S8 family serine peptidase n=1 Tax=Romboutsia sp. TaxID=1965302 RepID=UPI003F325D0F
TAVCNNAMLAGMVTVIANGNAGPDESTVGMPGAAPLPISVGASSVSIKLDTFEIKIAEQTLQGKLMAKDFSTSLDTLMNKELEIVDCGYGYETDYEGKDLSGKIALISRGDLSLTDKVANAKKAGALGAILFNNIDGEIQYYLGESVDFIPTLAVSKAVGDELLKSTGQKLILNKNGIITTNGDELADFSSRGPSDSEDIKPDIVAPGVSILSTYPEFMNHKEEGEDYKIAYTRMSGTSMASPQIAGIAALIEQEGKDNGVEYSAFDVKTKIMNSGEQMAKSYSVNEIGPGRVDAYDAVHSQISIQVLDKDLSLDDYGNEVTVDDITGSLSYKYIIQDETKSETSKAIDMVVKNKSEQAKNFTIEVEYLGTEHGGKDANTNNVKIELPQSINVAANSQEKLSPKIVIPKSADLGLYQGVIHIKDGEDDYRIPFSARHTKKGFNSEMNRVSVSSEIELTGTQSQGVHAAIDIMSPIERIDILFKDFDSDKIMGYGGSITTTGVRPGKYSVKYIVGSRPGYYPVDINGNINYVPDMLTEGKYKLVLQAINKDGSIITNEHPLLVDNEAPKITNVNHPEGVYELSEKNMTVEKDANGNDLKAFWIKGNIKDNSVDLLNSMNVDTSIKDIMAVYADKVGIVEENGDFRIPVTQEDLIASGRPLYGGKLMGFDQAFSYTANQDNNYTFINENEHYVSTTSKQAQVEKGQSMTVILNTQNINNASSLLLPLQFDKGFEVKKVKLTKEAEKLIKDNKYKSKISYNVRDAFTNLVADVKVDILDANGKPVNINLDIPLVEVEMKLVNDTKFVMYEARLECVQPEIKDKAGNLVELTNTIMRMYDHVQVIPQASSMLIQGNIPEGIAWSVMNDDFKLEDLNKHYWVEDAKGKKINLDYYEYFESFSSTNLPISKDKFRVVLDLPGHFIRKGTFSPYKIYNGKLISRYLDMSGAEVGSDILAGETNKDGAIDIVDAMNVAKSYNKPVTTEAMKNLDFNFDKKVDRTDMEYIVNNFGATNLQLDNYKEPELQKDGKTLEDVLKEIGYN